MFISRMADNSRFSGVERRVMVKRLFGVLRFVCGHVWNWRVNRSCAFGAALSQRVASLEPAPHYHPRCLFYRAASPPRVHLSRDALRYRPTTRARPAPPLHPPAHRHGCCVSRYVLHMHYTPTNHTHTTPLAWRYIAIAVTRASLRADLRAS